MRRRILFTGVIALVAVAFLVPAAAAKGVSDAEVTWEGLATPVAVGPSTTGAASLVGDTGIMSAMWAVEPSPMLDSAPTDDLGPAVTITWSLYGPPVEADTIVQLVYPYAAEGPLAFTAPGQLFFGTEQTVGGWFRAPARLTTILQDLGVPSRQSLEGRSDGASTRPSLPIGATLGGIAIVLTVVGIAARRRVGPAAATT